MLHFFSVDKTSTTWKKKLNILWKLLYTWKVAIPTQTILKTTFAFTHLNHNARFGKRIKSERVANSTMWFVTAKLLLCAWEEGRICPIWKCVFQHVLQERYKRNFHATFFWFGYMRSVAAGWCLFYFMYLFFVWYPLFFRGCWSCYGWVSGKYVAKHIRCGSIAIYPIHSCSLHPVYVKADE